MSAEKKKPNWKKIEAEYKSGIPRREIVKRHSVSMSALNSRIARGGWKVGKTEVARKTQEKCEEKIAEKQADILAELSGLQNKAVKVLYQKLMDSIVKYPDGAGTKTVRETVDVKEVQMEDGKVKKFPLRSSFTSDLESAVRAIATLGKLYGLDAGSALDKRRLELQYNPFGSDEPEDDGFLDALSKESAEAWLIEDVPANVNDHAEEKGSFAPGKTGFGEAETADGSNRRFEARHRSDEGGEG